MALKVVLNGGQNKGLVGESVNHLHITGNNQI